MALTKRWTPMKYHPEQHRFWTLPTRFKVVPCGRRCLAEGTLVATPSGPVAIENLKVGDEVFGFDGENSHITTVAKTWDNGVQEVIPLGGSNKVYINATEEHKLFACNERKYSANCFNNYDYTKIKIKNLTKRHRVRRVYLGAIITGGPVHVPYTYALGALLGNGCCRNRGDGNGNRVKTLSISHGDDYVPKHIASMLGCTYKKSAGNNYTYILYYGEGCVDAIPYYREWAFNKLSYEKCADWDIINTWDRDSCLAFLAGIVDTDGSIYYKEKDTKQICISITLQAKSVVECCEKIIHKYFQEHHTIHEDRRDKYVNGNVFYISLTSGVVVLEVLKALQPYLQSKGKIDVCNVVLRNILPDRIALIQKGEKFYTNTYDITVANETNLYILHDGGIVTSNSGKCIDSNALVSLVDGRMLPIKNVKVGDKVWSLNTKNNKLEEDTVIATHNNGMRKCLTVSTSQGELSTTPEHRFMVNGEWKEAKDINKGDLIYVPKHFNSWKTKTLEEIGVTQEELDMLALWMAEGSGHGQITTADQRFVEIMEKYASTLDNVHVLNVAKYAYAIREDRRSQFSNPWLNFLRKLDLLGKNCKQKSFPDFIFHLEKDALARFLSIFFGYDGSIYNKKCRDLFSWSFTIGLANKKLIQEVSALLLRFGIKCNYRHKVHGQKSSITGESFVSWGLDVDNAVYVHPLVNYIGLYSKEEKVEKAKIVCEEILARGGAGHKDCIPVETSVIADTALNNFKKIQHTLSTEDKKVSLYDIRCAAARKNNLCTINMYNKLRPYLDDRFDKLLDADIAYSRVKEVRETDILETWDITTENNHNFIANGFVVHNSELAKRKIVTEALKKVLQGNKPFHNARYAVCAPTYGQAKRIYWDDLKLLIPDRYKSKVPKESELIIFLKNDVEIHIIGMDKPARIEGTPWDGVIIDEFADVKPEAWSAHVMPALADRKGWCSFIGTPEGRNHYYDLFKYAQENPDKGWSAHTWKSADILDPEEIEKAKHTLDEVTYRIEYEACHALDTNVVHYDGRVTKICEIQIGDTLAYFDYKTNERKPCKVLASGLTKVKEMMKVVLDDGKTFKASHDHKMKINGNKVRLEDCTYLEKITHHRVEYVQVIRKVRLPEEQCWNITVDSPDHSYILANGLNNFNSFDETTGSAYHSFKHNNNCCALTYNKLEPLILCFDFNVSPGVAVICQEQILPGAFEYVADPELFGKGRFALQEALKSKRPDALVRVPVKGTGVIGEIYIPLDSNTEKVCDEIVKNWGSHLGKVLCYGDATGSNKGTSKVQGSDWDLIEKHLRRTFGDRLYLMAGKSNPLERVRLNAMNTRLKTMDGTVRMMIDEKACPKLVKDLEGVQLKTDGSGEIDKRKDPKLTHLCFSGDTLVRTSLGIFRMSDLPPTGYIHTPFGMRRYTNGGKVRGYKKTVYVHFKDQNSNKNAFIDCTHDHLVMTDKGFIEARKLRGVKCYFGNDAYAEGNKASSPVEFRNKAYSKLPKNGKFMKANVMDGDIKQNVYCPTVECGCFYLENGLLVSNSDSLGYYVCQEFPVFENSVITDMKVRGMY